MTATVIPINLARKLTSDAPEGSGSHREGLPLIPLSKQEAARGYSKAYFLMRAILRTEVWPGAQQPGFDLLMSAMEYCSHRYYSILGVEGIQ